MVELNSYLLEAYGGLDVEMYEFKPDPCLAKSFIFSTAAVPALA